MLLLVCWHCYHACFALLLPLVAADAATAAALAAGDRVMSPELLCQKDLRSPSTTLRAARNSNNTIL
jgi:hypothetical protein